MPIKDKTKRNEYDKLRMRRKRLITKSIVRDTPCNILKKHHEDMKNDPEHLTTDFIQRLIGIKCN